MHVIHFNGFCGSQNKVYGHLSAAAGPL
jgi:hypothetical protein